MVTLFCVDFKPTQVVSSGDVGDAVHNTACYIFIRNKSLKSYLTTDVNKL